LVLYWSFLPSIFYPILLFSKYINYVYTGGLQSGQEVWGATSHSSCRDYHSVRQDEKKHFWCSLWKVTKCFWSGKMIDWGTFYE